MWCLLASVYFFLVVGLHALIARLSPTSSRLHQFLLAGAFGGICLMVHLAVGTDGGLLPWSAGILAYGFACELYVFLFTFVTSSVSVAILVSRSHPQSADKACHKASLSPDEMLRRRLRNMVAVGLLKEMSGTWQLNGTAHRMVIIYQVLREFFQHQIAPEFKK